jgi:hypothetical protein
MSRFCAVLVLVSATVVLSADTTLGTKVTVKSVTPIPALVERPESFVGQTVRVEGVVTAVCTHMGCWMAVAPAGDPDGPTVRLKVEDGVIVFPVTAKGKRVVAQGVFERVGKDAESAEAAGEHASQDSKASKEYQVAAAGVIIRS